MSYSCNVDRAVWISEIDKLTKDRWYGKYCVVTNIENSERSWTPEPATGPHC